jgi:hypothetical protein
MQNPVAGSDKPARSLSASAERPTTANALTVRQLAVSSFESAFVPIKQAVTSPALRKAAVSSAILAVVVALSLGSAVIAYLVFYYLYVPRVGFKQEILLQYG